MDAKLVARLRERFKKVVRGCGLRTHTRGIEVMCDDILTAYSLPGRYYHTVEHLRQCLAMFDEVHTHFECPAEAEFALWYHDYIYYFDVPTDNEALSAIAASQNAQKLGMKEWQRQKIVSYVLATDHPRNIRRKLSPDAALIADIDLYGLSLSWDTVLKQSRNVRRECILQSDTAFADGNDAFFANLTYGRPLYLSPHFAQYEKAAQANILNMKRNMMSSIVSARPSDKRV